MPQLLDVSPSHQNPIYTHGINRDRRYRRHKYLLHPWRPATQTRPLNTQGTRGHGQWPHI